jgi:hypothetical protein
MHSKHYGYLFKENIPLDDYYNRPSIDIINWSLSP